MKCCMEQFFALQRAKNYKMFYENTIVLAWQKNEKLVTKKPVLTLNYGCDTPTGKKGIVPR